MRSNGCGWALFASAVALAACSSTRGGPASPKLVSSLKVDGRLYPYGSSGAVGELEISTVSADPTYGYTSQNPVKVAGLAESGPRAEQVFLSALRGPNGETIEYWRRGACCPFDTKFSELGTGLLDVYEVTYAGLGEPLLLYLDMYEPGEVAVPLGLSARERTAEPVRRPPANRGKRGRSSARTAVPAPDWAARAGTHPHSSGSAVTGSHSARRASVGSRRAARSAGRAPEARPVASATASAAAA
jgi:hypothetical protein